MFKVENFRIAAGIMAIGTLFLIGLGGFVRGTGAGLACPDWPLCYGRVIPVELQPGVAQEVGHRFLASIISSLMFLLVLWSYRLRKLYPRLWILSIGLFILLGLQVILGGLTVLMRLNPFIVTAHLALGTIFFQLSTVIAADKVVPTRQTYVHKRQGSGFVPVIILTMLVFFQIILGGFVGSSGASLACLEIPFCEAGILSFSATAPEFIQMLHRLNGILVFLLAAGITISAFISQKSKTAENYLKHFLFIDFMLVVQISLGFLSVYFKVPVFMAVAHLILAQCILLYLILLLKDFYIGKVFFFKRVNNESSSTSIIRSAFA